MVVRMSCCLVIFGVSFAVSAQQARDLSPSDIFRAASNSIVTVHALNKGGSEISQGSGVVIGRGLVVSNCHVVKDAAIAQVGYSGKRYPATRHDADPDRDLCSFDVAGLAAPSVTLGASSTLQVGDRVFAIGAPQGLELTLSDGLVSSLRPLENQRLIQTTAAISPGSSGGGLFDARGALVGITTMYLKDSQQLNFAVPVEWIAELPARQKQADWAATGRDVAAAQERARDAVGAWEKGLMASDPAGYARRKERLYQEAPNIGAKFPPDQWLVEMMRTYASLEKADEAADVQAAQAAADAAAAAANVDAANGWTPPQAPSTDRWRFLAKEEFYTSYLDGQTFEKKGDVTTAWIKMVFDKTAPEFKKGIREVVEQFDFDCKDHTYMGRTWAEYSKSGAVIKSGTDPYRWNSIIPGTVAEGWWQAACE